MHMQSINSFIQGTTMKHPNNQAVNELTLKYALEHLFYIDPSSLSILQACSISC